MAMEQQSLEQNAELPEADPQPEEPSILPVVYRELSEQFPDNPSAVALNTLLVMGSGALHGRLRGNNATRQDRDLVMQEPLQATYVQLLVLVTGAARDYGEWQWQQHEEGEAAPLTPLYSVMDAIYGCYATSGVSYGTFAEVMARFTDLKQQLCTPPTAASHLPPSLFTEEAVYLRFLRRQSLQDQPSMSEADYELLHTMELCIERASTLLLQQSLLPYWRNGKDFQASDINTEIAKLFIAVNPRFRRIDDYSEKERQLLKIMIERSEDFRQQLALNNWIGEGVRALSAA